MCTEEKELLLLPKLAEHCQRDTGRTLGQWREQYLDEQAAEQHTPGMEQRM